MKNNFLVKLLKVNLIISKYLLYALPVIIGTVIWALFVMDQDYKLAGSIYILWDILGWHFIIWFVLLIYFILSLLFFGAFRESILTLITFSKERDERESYISGRASKATFFSTLAILIFLFFASGLNVSIYKKPKEEAIDGKRGIVSIGYEFEFLSTAQKTKEQESKNEMMFEMNGVPFTQECILLFLIIYHIGGYHVFKRRRLA